jgi:hypothetical protein
MNEQEHPVLDMIVEQGFKAKGEQFADLKIYFTDKEIILYDSTKDSVYHRFEKKEVQK